MAITRAKQSSLTTGVTKYDNLRAGLPFTPTIGTATDGGTGTTVSVAFTGNNTAGLTYTALSTPGSLTGTSTTSPITVTGLSSGTAYTFAVKATNSAGDSPYSAASNSVTPATPSSYESIATATGTGSSGTITFSSIPSGYSSLQIRWIGRNTDTSGSGTAAASLTFNSDTGANYSFHRLFGNGASRFASGSASQNSITLNASVAGDASDANVMCVGILDIHDYSNTSKNKTVRVLEGGDFNGQGQIDLSSGLWINTSAITSLSIVANGSVSWNTQTRFSLYGIKA